jgi:hypothetical protein
MFHSGVHSAVVVGRARLQLFLEELDLVGLHPLALARFNHDLFQRYLGHSCDSSRFLLHVPAQSRAPCVSNVRGQARRKGMRERMRERMRESEREGKGEEEKGLLPGTEWNFRCHVLDLAKVPLRFVRRLLSARKVIALALLLVCLLVLSPPCAKHEFGYAGPQLHLPRVVHKVSEKA